MSADNFLGIYKASDGEYVARGCWSECRRNKCKNCGNRIVFVAHNLTEAITKAEEAIRNGDYEYGYRFLNLKRKENENNIMP